MEFRESLVIWKWYLPWETNQFPGISGKLGNREAREVAKVKTLVGTAGIRMKAREEAEIKTLVGTSGIRTKPRGVQKSKP